MKERVDFVPEYYSQNVFQCRLFEMHLSELYFEIQ